ncbi:hypothetical protein C7447_1011070 [Tenacibaculum adriaticum]|uniref:Uncharacterized protein n=1 Tax=Tenacibaculum adriaticum TaxID=413713 RepID=A0A5S5DWZ4_9FLAO|nr:hypothetical protein [Tenacibaculum adriaticum]TYQ00454.1 hypothetical protein C7447_1011070 [Tenacibaculum adriaticum]
MYLINVHAIPTKDSEYYDKVVGAYVSLYIDYADIEGAMQLSKFYIEEEGWKVESIDEEYYDLEDENDVDEDQKEFYIEAKEFGYTLVFNTYESDEEE